MVEVDLKALLDPRTLVGGGLKLVERFGDEAYFAAVCIRSGMVGPELPHRVAQMLLAFERHGMLAGAVTIGAIRHGDRVAIRDERGDVTYKELDERTNALANAWHDEGLRARRRRGHPRAQPPWLPGVRVRGGQAGREDHPAQHVLRRPPDPRGGRARGHRPARLRRRVRRGPRGRRSAPWPLARLGRRRGPAPRRGGRLARVAHRRRRHRRAAAGGPLAEDRHPHQRDHRHAQGRAARRAQVPGDHRRAALKGALPRPRDDRAGGPDVPRPGLRRPGARPGAGLDACRAPPLRSRGHARQPPGERGHGADRRPGDAPAHARAARQRGRHS